MTVSIILANKGREIVTIEPNASLAEAVRILAAKRIGAALILGADRRIAGIISERDIVRVLAERGAAVRRRGDCNARIPLARRSRYHDR